MPRVLYYYVVQLGLPEIGVESAAQDPPTEVRFEEGGLRRTDGTRQGQSRCMGTSYGPNVDCHPVR